MTEQGVSQHAAPLLIAVDCGHHDQATTGLALLEQRGIRNLLLMEGGIEAWEAAHVSTQTGERL